MNPPVPRQQLLRTVAVTARVQRLDLAALELNYSTRTIRRHIQRLEQELNQPLFHRIRGAHGGMRPTGACMQLIQE